MKNKIFARPVFRLIAFLTDFLIKFSVYLLIAGLVLKSGEIERVLDGFLIVTILYIYLSLILPVFFSYLTAKTGGSPGKIICGIKVLDENGKYLSFGRSLFRYFVGYNVSGMFLGLGYLRILTDEKRRGWHDMASGSEVIIKRPSGIFWGFAICAVLISFNIFLYGYYVNIFNQNKNNYQSAVNEILVESGIIEPTPTPTVQIKRMSGGEATKILYKSPEVSRYLAENPNMRLRNEGYDKEGNQWTFMLYEQMGDREKQFNYYFVNATSGLVTNFDQNYLRD